MVGTTFAQINIGTIWLNLTFYMLYLTLFMFVVAQSTILVNVTSKGEIIQQLRYEKNFLTPT